MKILLDDPKASPELLNNLELSQRWIAKLISDRDSDKQDPIYLGAKRQHDNNEAIISALKTN